MFIGGENMKKKIVSGEETLKGRLFYAAVVYGDEEKKAVMKSLENPWLASGPLVKKFEKEVAKRFGKAYGVAVNSGSSANLLAFASLKIPKGSEVITPACTFNTTVTTIVQNGLVPVFIDVLPGRYVINEDLIEWNITDKTKALMVPHLIGGVVDLRKLRKLADKHNLRLIDDSCDTFAPKIDGKPAAIYSDIVTTSFYASHIITALGYGGMVMTDNEEVKKRILLLRDWGRIGGGTEDFETRFNFKIDNISYDSKFLFTELGYNLKMNESAAAFGLEQLKKLPTFLKTRKRNFKLLYDYFKKYEDDFVLPELLEGAETNWLAFPLTMRTHYKTLPRFKRYDFLKHMESKGIQTRVLFSGNITRHPVYKKLTFRKGKGGLLNSDDIMAGGFLLGCHHGMSLEDVKYLTDSAEEFLSRKFKGETYKAVII